MADTKITALAAITTVDPAADVLPIVDISDTSMAASGTTKKITSNQILGAGGTATLASATITGAASAAGLSVTGSTIPTNGLYLPSANNLGFAYNSTLGMTLNATGLGVGVVPSAGKGALQLSSGINFPATQVASSDANTLDDYEEGTWTIGLTFGGGSTGITTSANTGRYTKVGRQVTVIGYLALTNKGSSTGSAVITGLPFTSPNSLDAFAAATLRFTAVSYTGTIQGIQLINSTKIELDNISDAGVVSSLTDSNFANSSSIMISCTYTV